MIRFGKSLLQRSRPGFSAQALPHFNCILPRQAAQIYTKGTDLDSQKYSVKRAEEEQLLTYYRNHMDNDKISEEERAEYTAKVDALLAKHKSEDAKAREAAQ